MTFTWMRRIDFWIGVPLARALGWLTPKAQSLFGDKVLTSAPKKVICSKFIGLGSVVLSLPLLKALKDQGAHVVFWTFPGQAELAQLSGLVDEVWVIRPSLREFIHSLFKTLLQARRFGADAFIDLEPTANFSALLARLAGSPTRIGFMSSKPTREALFTHLVALTSERHMVEHHIQMGILAGVPQGARTELPPVKVPGELRTLQVGRTIVLNINASDLSWHRMWSEDHWIWLAKDFLRDPSARLLFPGSKAERPRVERLVSRLVSEMPSCEPRVRNIAGQTSLLELMRVLVDASLVVSVDSGIMHMAAWAGAPVVGIFGPETPKLYAPQTPRSRVVWAALPCSPCLTVAADKITHCQDNQCMKRISAAQVRFACEDLLRKTKAA